MIEHLKQLYEKQIATDPSGPAAGKYDWFQTEDGPIGFLKTALSAKERSLLEVFLTPYLSGQNLNDKQAFWHHLLYSEEKTTDSIKEENELFRLIHFFVKDPSIDTSSFAEAVNGLFPSEMTILWETEQDGVLIEPTGSLGDTVIEYQDLADAVTSDFFTDLFLYVGRKQSRYDEAFEQNRKEKASFRLCRNQYPAENVFYHDQQIPFLLLEKAPKSAKKEFLSGLLGEAAEDRELLNSIYQYLVCNMNVTTAAKKLFIHRNSLQYRVDKFVEKTGLDVRSFPQAVTVYLALLDQFLPRSGRK